MIIPNEHVLAVAYPLRGRWERAGTVRGVGDNKQLSRGLRGGGGLGGVRGRGREAATLKGKRRSFVEGFLN